MYLNKEEREELVLEFTTSFHKLKPILEDYLHEKFWCDLKVLTEKDVLLRSNTKKSKLEDLTSKEMYQSYAHYTAFGVGDSRLTSELVLNPFSPHWYEHKEGGWQHDFK